MALYSDRMPPLRLCLSGCDFIVARLGKRLAEQTGLPIVAPLPLPARPLTAEYAVRFVRKQMDELVTQTASVRESGGIFTRGPADLLATVFANVAAAHVRPDDEEAVRGLIGDAIGLQSWFHLSVHYDPLMTIDPETAHRRHLTAGLVARVPDPQRCYIAPLTADEDQVFYHIINQLEPIADKLRLQPRTQVTPC